MDDFKILEKIRNFFSVKDTLDIDFIPSSLDVVNFVCAPVPAKNSIPLWYKNIPINKPLEFDEQGKSMNLKMCMPFLDSLTIGYLQETWTEIVFFKRDNKTEYKWAHKPEILNHREKINIPINESYGAVELIWKMPWIPKLPKGYSILVTHPFNRYDLPFVTSTGIIDADDFHHIGSGQIPFYLQKDFEGYIPIGTPIYQMIPFKREKWKNNVLPFDEEDLFKKEYAIRNVFSGAYKKLFWKKKKFD